MIILVILLLAITVAVWVFDPYLDIYRDNKDDFQIILWYSYGSDRKYIKILGDLYGRLYLSICILITALEKIGYILN